MSVVNYSGRYDAIVVGVGAMGSATAYYLARRGKRVLGLERFGIPHTMGSYHGHTRIIRSPTSSTPPTSGCSGVPTNCGARYCAR